MEDGHLASLGRSLDWRFCNNRCLATFILVIVVLLHLAVFMRRGIGPGDTLVGNRCSTAVLRERPGLAELCTATGTEVGGMGELFAAVVTELGGCCHNLLFRNMLLLYRFMHHRPTLGSGAFLLLWFR